MWTFPTAQEIVDFTSKFSTVVTGRDFMRFIPWAKGEEAKVIKPAEGNIDATAWRVGNEMLVSVVVLGVEGAWSLILPDGVKEKGIIKNLWSNVAWSAGGNGEIQVKSGTNGEVENYLFIVEVED